MAQETSEEKLKKRMKELEEQQNQLAGRTDKKVDEDASALNRKIAMEKVKKRAAAKAEAGEGAKASVTIGDMHKPGGKKFSPIASKIEDLYAADPSAVTKAQKEMYKKLTGKELK